MKGLVIKSTGSWYTILPNRDNSNESVQARLRGSLRLTGASSTAPVVVGDIVECVQNTQNEWVIDSVDERRNYLVRRSTNLSRQKHIIASNIDTLYVVVTLASPETSLEFIDRVLAASEAYEVEAKIIVNKIDIANPNELFLEIYEKAGYPIFLCSAATGEGIDKIREEVKGKTVLLTGNSGVGKSSLINAIDPEIGARTGEISSYHQKGKHTTTFSEIFSFGENGFLIDTPGIKGFGLVDVESSELYHYFREIMQFSADCSFYNCTHTHEPKCAVKKAVDDDLIAYQRYESYLKMMETHDEKYR